MTGIFNFKKANEHKQSNKTGLNILILRIDSKDTLPLDSQTINLAFIYHAIDDNFESHFNSMDVTFYDIVIFLNCESNSQSNENDKYIILQTYLPIIRSLNGNAFIIVFSMLANESGVFREFCFKCGCNMVTKDMKAMTTVFQQIWTAISNGIRIKNDHKTKKQIMLYSCPYPKCEINDLTEDDLWTHCPLFHIGVSNSVLGIICPICNKTCNSRRHPFQVHLRNQHGPCARNEEHAEYSDGISSYFFSLVVCRRPSDGKFLLVQEFASCGFWLPGGRVDPGESLQSAAIRETEEEAGVAIELKGILRVEFNAIKIEDKYGQHLPEESYNRTRVIFYAEPKQLMLNETNVNKKQVNNVNKNSNDENGCHSLAKSIPDYESMGASWIEISELDEIKLRSSEPKEWLPYVFNGEPIYPLKLLEDRQTVKVH